MFNLTVKILSFFILFSFNCIAQQTVKKIERPNVILILTDDQAFGDLAITGNSLVQTPNIDKLALEGTMATNFYVSPVCAPTRASLLTGRYYRRTGVSGVTRGLENMNLNEITLANIFKSEGYATGIFGKWHNGAHYPYHPLGRGFDEFVGFTSGHWPNYFDTTIEKNKEPVVAQGYLPDFLTNEAIRFIQKSAQKNEPFLCYIPYQTPHTPLQVPDKYFDKFKAKGIDDFNATIYGMCENIDDNVGKIVKILEELKIKDNTIIIYMSDNGPLNLRFNAGLKGKKGSVDEGGMKVPFIINWKNKIKEKNEIHQPLAHIDVLPTLMDLLQINFKSKNTIDGVSFKKSLYSNETIKDRNLYENWSDHQRVLSGDYLLVDEELFNLKLDPSQLNNIRNEQNQVYDLLKQDFISWSDSLPKANDLKPIPVGYNNSARTILPAHEANLFPPFEFRKDRKQTGIAYHSLYGWAHDWIDFWTKTTAYAVWDINVVESGVFECEIRYALAKEDVGSKLVLEIDNQKILIENLEAFEHAEFPDFDRVKRDQESPETNWKTVKIGQLKLSKGNKTVKISSLEIPGKKSIELKEIHIIKK
jgi:arylsulfatase A-like enzyme